MVQDYIYDQYNITIKKNSLRKSLIHSKNFRFVKGIPLESNRSKVCLDTIIQYYDQFDKCLESLNVPPEFFFNVDESGFQEFVDSKIKKVVVPSSYHDNEIIYSSNRSAKRSTMIGAIAMDGTSLLPVIVIQNKTIEKKLYNLGYNQSNCLIVHQNKGFINSEIFSFWAEHVFFPEITKRRKQFNYHGTAILTLDGCSAHFSDHFLDNCTFYNVYPYQEPPGSSDQVQPLDLGIFGIQKILLTPFKTNEKISNSSKKIIEIVNSWKKATLPCNITSAFHQAGFYLEEKNNINIVRVNIKHARAVREINHIPSKNIINGKQTVEIPGFS